jgi:hypothetical protein
MLMLMLTLCGIEQNDEACSHKDSVLRTAYCVTGKETRPKGPSVCSTTRSVGLGIHVVRGNYLYVVTLSLYLTEYYGVVVSE